ncbi:MAG TPA: hypothetical protein VMD27_08350 [Candidatus Aquilonibacter sp.]|nr:hypothetical protein [Candidatus Aquilonibacter sp.]
MKNKKNLFSLDWLNRRTSKSNCVAAHWHLKWVFVTAVVGSLLAGLGQAEATLIYDNGPIDGTMSAWTINEGFSVSDSFTVSSSTSLSSVQIGLWLFPNDTPTSVEWSIGTTPYGNDVSSGTGSLVNVIGTLNMYGFDLDESTFTISGSLAAGTYYLTLQDAVTADGDSLYWDINNGPSTAYENTIGNVANDLFPGSNSDSFQLYGTSSFVPDEASTFLLLGFSGLSLIGAARWTRKSALS